VVTGLRWGALLAALVLTAIGVTGLVRADDGLRRVSVVSDGVPLETVTSTAPASPGPGVVVAHGFAGSTPLMRGFADTLARAGYTVVLLDFAGHGQSREPFDQQRLDHDLTIALAHVRGLPTVDPTRVGLVGHSMGAGAVLRTAAADRGVAATVAISAGSVPERTDRVRDLMVLAGSLEFTSIRETGPDIVGAAHPGARPDRTYGDPVAGTARRFGDIPVAEHISVLFSPTTHRATLDWFDAALQTARVSPASVHPLDRVGPALLLHLAAVLGFGALAALVLPVPGTATTRTPLASVPPAGPRGARPTTGHGGSDDVDQAEPASDAGWAAPAAVAVAGPVVAAATAVLVMYLVPAGWLPVQVADYAIGWMTVFGLVLLALARPRVRTRPGPGAARTAFGTVVLAAFTVAGFAVPAHLGWAYSVPAGVRLWLLIPAFVAGSAVAAALEGVAAGRSPGRAALGHAWSALVLVSGLTGAALVGGAPGFVLFVAPLLAVLLAWQGVTAAALRRKATPRWLIAVVGGALLAWPLALTFPVTA
jgi:pimeloyl-ACP methyl ester carboxylesterase